MLHCLLVYKLGGVKIALLCCLVKSGVGKTYATVGKMCFDEVENERGEDIFYHFSEINSSRTVGKEGVNL